MPVQYTVFPRTTHAFDHSLMGDTPVTFQQGGRTITHRYNPESVAAAWRLTLEFLGRHLGGAGPR
jgi:dienelactone hydrolase